MATATVGALKVVLGLDSAAFTDGLTAAQKHLKGVGKSMQSLGTTLAAVGTGITATVTAPIIALGIQMGRAAIDAEEMQSAFSVSFGGMAKDVQAWAVSTGDAMGRSTFELQQMALGFNGLFKAGGPISPMATDLSKQFTVLAQDLSSFHNVAEQDVFQALRSGLSGEAEPLRRFNVYLTEAAVKAEAMRMGLGKAGSELSEQAKIQARASLIMKGTAEAQGDVLRTSTSTANQLRTLNSQWAELQVTLGQKILPVFTPVVAAFNQAALAVSKLSPQMQGFVVLGAAAAAALGPVLVAVGAVVASLGALTAAFATGGVLAGLGAFAVAAAPFVAAAAAIAAAIYVFRDDLAPVFAEFKAAVMDAIGPAIPPLLAALKTAFDALGPAIKALVDRVGPILAGLGKVFLQVFGPILLMQLRVAVAGITSAFNLIAKALKFVAALLTGDWRGAWNAAGSFVMEIVRSIGRLVEAVFPGIVGHVSRMVQGVTSWLQGKLFDVLKGVVEKVRWVSDAFFKLYDAVVGHSYVPDMVEGVADWMAKLDAGMVQPAVSATDATKSAFEKLRDDVAAIMEGLLTDSERAARELANKTKTIRDGVAARLLTANQGAQAEAGIAGQNLTMPDTIGTISPIDTSSVQDAMDSINAGIEASREKFADAFEYGIDSALRGDWKGVLSAIVGDSFRDGLRNLGRTLFDALSKIGSSGGGTSSWSNIGSAISSFFSKGIPGFSAGVSNFGGGLAYVHGGEVLANLAPGTDVIPKREVGKLGRGGGGVVVTFAPVFDARGAGPREVDTLRAEMARMQREMPSTIVRTVADAKQRRVL